MVLLPFFFISAGLRADFAAPELNIVLLIFALATLVAVAGKMVGAAIPARLSGFSWRDTAILGSFLQCKGLMELIVLTMLLDAGILSAVSFSALLLMAIATTAITKPLVIAAQRLPG
jgi:Kef-type K+ transport system membrane component KefB